MPRERGQVQAQQSADNVYRLCMRGTSIGRINAIFAETRMHWYMWQYFSNQLDGIACHNTHHATRREVAPLATESGPLDTGG